MEDKCGNGTVGCELTGNMAHLRYECRDQEGRWLNPEAREERRRHDKFTLGGTSVKPSDDGSNDLLMSLQSLDGMEAWTGITREAATKLRDQLSVVLAEAPKDLRNWADGHFNLSINREGLVSLWDEPFVDGDFEVGVRMKLTGEQQEQLRTAQSSAALKGE